MPESVAPLTIQTYEYNARRTEAKPDEMMLGRMTAMIPDIWNKFALLRELGPEFDRIKRFVYYGDMSKERGIPNRQFTTPATEEMEARHICDLHLFHGLLGVVTEIAELIEGLSYNDSGNAQEEVGDLCWYLPQLAAGLNVSLESIMDANIRKLQARYPNKWEQGAALNRDLAVEERALKRSEVEPEAKENGREGDGRDA